MGDRNNNYYIKFRYQDWLALTQLMKPLHRDILHIIYCRRAVCHKMGIELNDTELDGLRKQFYRDKRKQVFMKVVNELVDQRMVIKSKDPLKKDHSYTTVMNEAVEAELARTVELTARREQKRAMRELGESKKGNEPVLLSNKLRAEFESYKDIDRN
jgi:hypothetical protein